MVPSVRLPVSPQSVLGSQCQVGTGVQCVVHAVTYSGHLPGFPASAHSLVVMDVLQRCSLVGDQVVSSRVFVVLSTVLFISAHRAGLPVFSGTYQLRCLAGSGLCRPQMQRSYSHESGQLALAQSCPLPTL